MVNNPLHRVHEEIFTELTKAQDQYVLDYFGSVENFLRFKDQYVLETMPVELELDKGSIRNGFRMRANWTFRLRPKTVEELAEELI